MITQHAWMFLSSYEKLREKMMLTETVNMAHLGARAFEEIGGEVVQTTAFVSCGRRVADFKGTYVRLVDIVGEWEKETAYRSGNHRYTAKQENFSKIPGSPVAYWVSENFVRAFENKTIIDYVYAVSKGIITTKNELYIRLWYEVSKNDIFSGNWHKYSKGGQFRRWYGNSECVILWKNNGFELKSQPFTLMGPSKYYGLEHFVWSGISSYKSAYRFDDRDVYFDDVAPAVLFKNVEYKFYFGALCNSNVVSSMLDIINPTLHFLAKDIKSLPVIIDDEKKPTIDELVKENIALSKTDWDSFETSWDFEGHPLV